MALPLVSCLMATTLDPARSAGAVRAVDDFFAQTYERRELVIAHPPPEDDRHLELRLLRNVVAAAAREMADPPYVLFVEADGTCGHRKAAALDRAAGVYCVAWDDDDRSHPRRLEVQAGSVGAAAGSALADRLVVDLRSRTLTWHRSDVGPPSGFGGLLPATLLFRRTASATYAPGGPATEDGLFVAVARSGPIVAIADRPYLACKVIHAANATDPDQLRRAALRHAAPPELARRHGARLLREHGRLDWGGREFKLAGIAGVP